MVDRQDIDALLIGSLYGELSSTEEARLAAHLESHPADRTALANLTRAREAIRESRLLQVQVEPPQSISALLMQEAVRRAPKQRDEMSWFQRFMRSVLLHPAMAAAAMLVLIIGVAGTVYLKRGDQFARPTKDEAPAITAGPTDETVATPAANGQPSGASAAANSEQYRVGLDEGVADGRGAGERQSAEHKPVDDSTLADRGEAQTKREVASTGGVGGADKNTDLRARTQQSQLATAEQTKPPARPAKVAQPPMQGDALAKTAPRPEPKAKAAENRYLEVTTPAQRPKDFDGKVASRDDAAKQDSVAGNRMGAAAPSPTTSSVAPPPAPPPPPAEAEMSKPAEARPDPMVAWAKEQHGKAIAAAKKDCKQAASIAMQIANRAPAYYTANIENDRALKSCQQYIIAEREKELERTNRAKAAPRRAADEAPAKPAPTTK